MITLDEIKRYDKLFRYDGIDLPRRPMAAGLRWLEENNTGIFDFARFSELVNRTTKLYQSLYPNRDFNEHGLFHGGVAFRGEVYKATVHVAFGSNLKINPADSIKVSKSELKLIADEYPEDFWEGLYSVGDLWDFAYGADDLRGKNQAADESWQQARSQLAATFRTLDANHDLDSAIQSICMTAELAMKGVLFSNGYSKSQVRKLAHNLGGLAIEVNNCTTSQNPGRLEMVVNQFPPYVQSRYKPSGLTKDELLKLAMQSQFVAGECLRRVSDRDMSTQMEADVRNPPRRVV